MRAWGDEEEGEGAEGVGGEGGAAGYAGGRKAGGMADWDEEEGEEGEGGMRFKRRPAGKEGAEGAPEAAAPGAPKVRDLAKERGGCCVTQEWLLVAEKGSFGVWGRGGSGWLCWGRGQGVRWVFVGCNGKREPMRQVPRQSPLTVSHRAALGPPGQPWKSRVMHLW